MSNFPSLDIIIFGASGFTGKYTVLKAVEQLDGFRWGIAGRNMEKLKDVLQEMSRKSKKNILDIPIIIADVEDEQSLLNMTRQCKVVINCVGPFCLYGEPVVKACIETGTHQIDVTAEPVYMEELTKKYSAKAKETKAYIIPACGFDCIPLDLGTSYLQQKFQGTVNSVEIYLELTGHENIKGPMVHYGTWASIVLGIAKPRALLSYRRTHLYPKRFEPVLKERFAIHKSELTKKWCVPYLTADRSAICRSQQYFYEKNGQRPAQVRPYLSASVTSEIFGALILGLAFLIFTATSFGRNLLLKHPKFFSFKKVTKEDISEENMEAAKANIFFKAIGWSEKFPKNLEKYDAKPDKEKSLKLSFTNLYYATSDGLIASAKTLIADKELLPEDGGVYTPAIAFSKTNIIKLLEKNNWNFEISESD